MQTERLHYNLIAKLRVRAPHEYAVFKPRCTSKKQS